MDFFRHLVVLTSEIVEMPEVVGLEWVEHLTTFLNSTFGLTLTGIAGGLTGIVTFLRTFFPVHKDFLKVNTAVAEVKEVAVGDHLQLQELQKRQEEFEIQTNEKLALIALKSPNAKVKDFGSELMKQVEEKKKAIKLPKMTQLEETIKVLKEK
jgi:hypothetical protein